MGFYVKYDFGGPTVSLTSHESKLLELKDIRKDLQCMATAEYIKRKHEPILFITRLFNLLYHQTIFLPDHGIH